ncbi:hypothetical protein [Luteipulveratus mongoliensis]|uniref:Uncharacterized protein n=1 Tax=Luteipulveratus mongoliensis TaxID=571913 RepID=A0A0K1JH11_9MICO|nr:hypothetical protein [Luteipulveratus mongoliensis]AKU15991.1 hypothetical protein VV02_09195 [Luteipulveratus mongoliensis]
MGGSGSASTQITAGLGGFVVLFGLAIVCYFLFRSMNNRLRGVRYREEQEQKAREAAERDAESGAPEPGGLEDGTPHPGSP